MKRALQFTWPPIAILLSIAFLAALFASSALAAQSRAELRGIVLDENGVPVPGVEVLLRDANPKARTSHTDEAGRFAFVGLTAGDAQLTLTKAGFFALSSYALALREGTTEVALTLSHETEVHEKVEVTSSTARVDPQDTSHQATIVAREIRDIPVPSTHVLQNSLVTLPGVIRDPVGGLHIAGSRVADTAYFLDGFEIGDPATGALNARLAVDSIRAVEVQTGRFSAAYPHAAAGVLAIDTAAGDDRWRFGTTNFIPGIHLQRGVRLGNWYPRFNFSGPLQKGRMWFSETLSVQHTFHVVREQPRGADSTTVWSGDSLTRLQFNITPRQILQGSFLYNREDGAHLGLDALNPLSTTTDLDATRLFGSVKDQIFWSGALFEIGFAADQSTTKVFPRGTETYIQTPSGTSGNFFQSLDRDVRRLQWLASVAVPSRHWHGTHDFAAGVNGATLLLDQLAVRGQIEVRRKNGTRLRTTVFSGPSDFELNNKQAGGYIQDTWRIVKPLVIQVGVRTDWDQIVHAAMVEPRIAVNVLPFRSESAKLSLAWGVYNQPLNLALLGQALDQQQSDTFYNIAGEIIPPGLFRSRFVVPAAGLEQPRVYTSSAEWRQKIRSKTVAGIHLMARDGRREFAFEDAGRPRRPEALFVLHNNRRDRYRSAEIYLRHSFSDNAEIFSSYTRSTARTNEAFDPVLGALLFSPQKSGPLAWDTPNRLVTWGWAPLPVWEIFFSYFFEYRTGFPFNVINQQLQVVGRPGRQRFPDYLSLNLGVEKTFRFRGYAFAARVAAVNITGRKNPDTVVNNNAASNFLTFKGGQRRAFTLRLRFVGRK